MEIGCFYDIIESSVKEMGFSDIDEALSNAYESGIRSVDVSSAYLKDDPEAFGERIKRHGMTIASVHGLLRCPFKTEEEREKSIASMKQAMDLAKRAGTSRFMIVPQIPGNFDMKDKEEFRTFVIEIFKESAKYGESIGLIPTVENFSNRFYPYTTVQDIEYLLSVVPELKFTYDSGNFTLAGISEVEAAKIFAERTVYCHLKDVKECEKSDILRDGKYYDSIALGDGFMDNKTAISYLKNAGYEGPLIIEICSPVDKFKMCKRSIEYLENL